MSTTRRQRSNDLPNRDDPGYNTGDSEDSIAQQQTTRLEEEIKRLNTEIKRLNTENYRLSNENDRLSDENGRITIELKRNSRKPFTKSHIEDSEDMLDDIDEIKKRNKTKFKNIASETGESKLNLTLGDYNSQEVDALSEEKKRKLDFILDLALLKFTTRQELSLKAIKKVCDDVEAMLASAGLKRSLKWLPYVEKQETIVHVDSQLDRVRLLSFYSFGLLSTERTWREMARLLLSLSMLAEYRNVGTEKPSSLS